MALDDSLKQQLTPDILRPMTAYLRTNEEQLFFLRSLLLLTSIERSIADDVISNKDRVFVHCSYGISRAPTVVLAFLVEYEGYTVRQAFELLLSRRPVIGPNLNFMYQVRSLPPPLHTRRPANRLSSHAAQLLHLEMAHKNKHHQHKKRDIPSLPLQYYLLHQEKKEHLYNIWRLLDKKPKCPMM